MFGWHGSGVREHSRTRPRSRQGHSFRRARAGGARCAFLSDRTAEYLPGDVLRAHRRRRGRRRFAAGSGSDRRYAAIGNGVRNAAGGDPCPRDVHPRVGRDPHRFRYPQRSARGPAIRSERHLSDCADPAGGQGHRGGDRQPERRAGSFVRANLARPVASGAEQLRDDAHRARVRRHAGPGAHVGRRRPAD